MNSTLFISGSLVVLAVVSLSIIFVLRHENHPRRSTGPTSPSTFTYPPLNVQMFTDSPSGVLNGPANGGSIAKSAPTIDFGIVTIDANRYSTDYGIWGNIVLGPDGKYYYGLGDHSAATGGSDGALLMSYDPGTKRSEILIFSKDIFGPGGEGKFHGRPDINPATGDMYLLGFYTGHLAYYNIYTHQAKDLGVPVPGSGWPEHTWDWQRDRLYGVGNGKKDGDILVYDTKNKTVIHKGLPVDAATGQTFAWDSRARFLDRSTGILYATSGNRIVKYNPTTNTFSMMNSHLTASMRAMTLTKEPEGYFWVFDTTGGMYKFYPEQDKVISVGKNWGRGYYSAAIAESSDHHYLYFSISKDGDSQGLPIIQYDTRTNQKKVIAFLSSESMHGYHATKIYGLAMGPDDSTVFTVINGDADGTRYPAVVTIHIPASERQ